MHLDLSGIVTSVIIPNYNNADRLSQCLQAVTSQVDAATEIIVVDNQSTDDSKAIATSFDEVILLTEEEIKSPYACRHRGIHHARGTVIVLLDSKAIPMEHWLRRGLEALEEETADIISGMLVPEYQHDPPGRLERFDFLHSVVERMLPSSLPAGNLFFRKKIYQNTGGFDPGKRSLEDMSWTTRAARQGYRLRLCPSARFSYPVKSGAAFRKKFKRFGRAQITQDRKRGFRSITYILKNLLPPNPAFYRRMKKLDRQEQTGLGSTALYLICWYVKLLYARGALQKTAGR